MTISALIPVYKPTLSFVALVKQIATCGKFEAVIVVNDGSGPACDEYFEAIKLEGVHLLRHAVNLGKGAALKTGLNYFACNYPESLGIVTADADGQHQLDDILTVASLLERNPGSLVFGSRQFDTAMPLSNRFGNTLTRYLVRLLVGCKLTDTQTGLRGIPSKLIPELLRVKSNRYEFELDMIMLCRRDGIPIKETFIKTIYIDNNRSSHFNPLTDSMKIYFVLFRFMASSMATTLVDFCVFTAAYWTSDSLIGSLIAARVVAVNLNYLLVRNAVFNSHEGYAKTLPKYLVLTAFSGAVTYVLIQLIVNRFSISVVIAKACAEILVFFFSFAVQRELIFAPNLTEE
jgi:glycosyltransferase involved in cell wall biosynthesis